MVDVGCGLSLKEAEMDCGSGRGPRVGPGVKHKSGGYVQVPPPVSGGTG